MAVVAALDAAALPGQAPAQPIVNTSVTPVFQPLHVIGAPEPASVNLVIPPALGFAIG